MKTLPTLSLTFLILLFSCKNTGKTSGTEEDGRGDLIEEQPIVTSITKVSETVFAAPNGDSIKLQKTFLKAFEGEIEGKKAQAYLSHVMPSEDCSYYVAGQMYVADDSCFVYFGLEPYSSGKWKSSLDEWSQEQSYQYEFALPASFTVIKNGQRYSLKESEVRYQAYDDFNYSMTYCFQEETLFYHPHWNFRFQAVPVQYPEAYTAFFKQNPLDKIGSQYYSPAYKKWGHQVRLEIVEGNVEEEDCYTTFGQSYFRPCYLDSAFFVVSYFSHEYAGGAHGVYGHTYFNFDVKTGKLIKLKDILHADDHQFIKFYIDRLTKEYTMEDGEVPFLQTPKKASENFFILPEGITFSYYPYELMGFAAGEPELFLSWEELGPFLIREIR